jgi:hypothetical protein
MEQWPQEVTLDGKPAAQSSRPNVGLGGNSESSVSGRNWPRSELVDLPVITHEQNAI